MGCREPCHTTLSRHAILVLWQGQSEAQERGNVVTFVIRFVALLSCLASGIAGAAVELLEGSSPQRVLVGEVFQPVRLRVTHGGIPVAGAVASFRMPPPSTLSSVVPGVCESRPLELSFTVCTAVSGTDGIAEFRGLKSPSASPFSLTVEAGKYGSVQVILLTVPRGPAIQLEVLSGAAQETAVGTRFREPLVMRLLSQDGRPLAGGSVATGPISAAGTVFGFDIPLTARATTDALGILVFPPIDAGWVPGRFALWATIYDPDANGFESLSVPMTVTNGRGGFDLNYTNMWWAGPPESGWGVSVVKRADTTFNVLFVYDADGKPTWYVQPGATWYQGWQTSVSDVLYSPRSSPWFAYDASRFAVGEPVGRMAITFSGEERAELRVRLADRDVTKNLERQDFTGERPSPIQGLAGMWWGGQNQNGWGIAILEQFGNLFCVWLTYGEDGKPTWFVMPGGEWQGDASYSGTIHRTAGSAWIERPYDASQLRVTAVGAYTLRFPERDHAFLDYTLDGRSGTLELFRQPLD